MRRLFPSTKLGCAGGFGTGYGSRCVAPTPSFARTLLSDRSRGDTGKGVFDRVAAQLSAENIPTL